MARGTVAPRSSCTEGKQEGEAHRTTTNVSESAPSAGPASTSVPPDAHIDMLPRPSAPSAAPHVFISHAGEQKYNLVDHIRGRFADRYPSLELFVDEWSLQAGDRSLNRISAACWGASVGVLILSKEFVRKAFCMAELRVLLQRWTAASAECDTATQADQAAASGPEQPVQLLPVLYGLTLKQLRGMRALYDSEPWCVPEDRPSVSVLDTWAAELQEVAKVTMMRPDQWHGDSQLVDLIVSRVVQQLEAAKKLPPDLKPSLEVRKYAPSPSGIPLVGRQQELEQGLQALREQRYVELRGPPGEGKSTLAQHLVAQMCLDWEKLPAQGAARAEAAGQFAYAVEVNMRDLVDFDGSLQAAVAVKVLGTVQGAAATEQQHPVASSQWPSLLGWLNQQRRVVLLFENAEAALLEESLQDQFQPMVKALRAVACVHIIVATRAEAPFVEGASGDRTAVVLHKMSEAEGMEVVEAHLGPEHRWAAGGAEKAAARQLVALADSNPLVLSVAAGLVKTKDLLTWQDVVQKAHAGLTNVNPASKRKAGGMKRPMLLLHNWLASFLDAEEQQCLAALTVFPGSFTAAGAAVVTRQAGVQEPLAELSFASLVWRYTVRGISMQDEDEERYALHALVREAAEMLLCEEREAVECRQQLVHWMLLHGEGPGQMLLQCAPGQQLADTKRFWYLVREEVLNFGAAAVGLNVALEWWFDIGVECVVAEAARGVGQQLSGSGHGKVAMELQVAAVGILERALGAEHPETLASKGHLGMSLRASGELGEARRMQGEVLEAQVRVLGAEHADTLATQSNLAMVLAGLGEAEEASVLLEEVLEVRTLVLGADDASTLTCKSNLAGTLLDLGRLQQAARLQEEVYEARVAALGAEHPATLTSQTNLASTLLTMGEVGWARQLQEDALEVFVRVMGAEHPETLTCKGTLGRVLGAAGEWEEARRLQEEVLEVRERVLGPAHPATLSGKSNLAGSMWAMGELGAARRLQEEVHEMQTRVLGAAHPDTMVGKANLANTLMKLGELGEARRLQEEVVVVQTQALGPEHPATLVTRSNLVTTLHGLGELEGARKVQEEVLAVQVRVLGQAHPDILLGKNNLASIMSDVGELGEAKRLHGEVLEVRERVLGPAHPDTLATKNNLGITLLKLRELGEARRLQEEVLGVQADALGPEHPDTLTSKDNLAATLWLMGERGAGVLLLKEVLEVRRRVLGAEHPSTTATNEALEFMLGMLGGL